MGSTNTALTVPSRDIDEQEMVTVYLMLCLVSLQVVLNNRVICGLPLLIICLIVKAIWLEAGSPEYIAGERMDRNRTWGSDVEIVTIADLLRTKVYSYNETQQGYPGMLFIS